MKFPDDPVMQVSHETIYRALLVQGRGELRRELVRCPRTGRVKRRARRRPENTGQIRDMVMISERPPEADDRAVPGHWEGDLLIGGNCRSAVGTLVERTTRYLLLRHLPDGRNAIGVERAMRQAITTLPEELRRRASPRICTTKPLTPSPRASKPNADSASRHEEVLPLSGAAARASPADEEANIFLPRRRADRLACGTCREEKRRRQAARWAKDASASCADR